TMNTRSARIQWALLCLFLSSGLLSAAVAPATTAPTVATADEKVVLEKFVVTGSLIPFAADSPAIPIKLLSAAEIEKTGISTDLADVLRRSQPAFYGANNLGS